MKRDSGTYMYIHRDISLIFHNTQDIVIKVLIRLYLYMIFVYHIFIYNV